MPLLQSLIPRACKQGIKSKAGAIKCCKEIKITTPNNEWRNIPLLVRNRKIFMDVIIKDFPETERERERYFVCVCVSLVVFPLGHVTHVSMSMPKNVFVLISKLIDRLVIGRKTSNDDIAGNGRP